MRAGWERGAGPCRNTRTPPSCERHVEKFAKGDLEGYGEYFAEDVVWHVGGDHPLSGDYKGRDSLLEYFGKVRDPTGGTLQIEVHEAMADDSHYGVFARVTGERDGRSLDIVVAQAFLVAGGKLTEYWALADDQDAVDSFWSDGGEGA